MCMPVGPFGGELQMWAYLSGKTARGETERHLETLQTENPLRTPHRWAPLPRAATGPFYGLPFCRPKSRCKQPPTAPGNAALRQACEQ